MIDIPVWLLGLFALLFIALLFMALRRPAQGGQDGLEKTLREELRAGRKESRDDARNLREEVTGAQKNTSDAILNLLSKNEEKMEQIRNALNANMKSLQESNEKKLDQMRQTVDEKLQNTLERRLGESFKQVGERLEAVQRGLGEMQNLAAGVGDLKRVLTNVKTRGTWGEVQLGAILEEMLTAGQYERNVAVRPGGGERVEFAVRLPGAGDDSGPVWLPIDAKFPQEDYQRLVSAAETADAAAVEQSARALVRSLESAAGNISEKYLAPPHTTDFAIMFLPTEGLYAEALKQPGLAEKLQRQYRVVVAGPTTLTAILSSLQMGFRTLAIEKRSSEVWKLLAAVKTEFHKFGDVLGKVKKQLDRASSTIDNDVGRRTRAMARQLRAVETLPGAEAGRLLNLPVNGAAAEEAADDASGADDYEDEAAAADAAEDGLRC